MMETERVGAWLFESDPWDQGFTFSECPAGWGDEPPELDEHGLDEHGNDCDPCEGCPGYGPECGAIWTRKRE